MVVDALLAVAIAIPGVLDILSGSVYRPLAPWMLALLISVGALLFRRRSPLLVLAIVLLLQATIYTENFDNDPPFQFFTAVIACFSVGAYVVPRISGVALAGAVAFIALFNTMRGAPWDISVGSVVLFTGAWAAGLALYISNRRKQQVEERAATLESEGTERAQQAVAEERARIARELHDAVAHSVSVMTLQVGAVRHRLKADQSAEQEMLSGVEKTGREAVTELQRMLGLLRESDTDSLNGAQPSLSRLDELVEQVRVTGLQVDLSVEGDARPLPVGVDASAYRIIQEALTNVLKHAEATAATVLVRYNSQEIELQVEDDSPVAVKFPLDHTGHGLLGMRERVSLYGGRFEAGPRSTGGFAVRATLPSQ